MHTLCYHRKYKVYGSNSFQCGGNYNWCWCPTWINAAAGPIWLCDEHAKAFRPKFNGNIKGSFHWNDEAESAYERCTIVSRKNSLKAYYQLVSLALKSRTIRHIDGVHKSQVTLFHKSLREVQGYAWLITYYNVVMLGPASRAASKFPVLFKDQS